MMKLKGKILKYGDLWYFIPDGYTNPLFYSDFSKMWVLAKKIKISSYWHRHVIGYVSIDKVMVK